VDYGLIFAYVIVKCSKWLHSARVCRSTCFRDRPFEHCVD